MNYAYILTVFDKPHDTSWKWAFLNKPSSNDIHRAVHGFLARWQDVPHVYNCYTSWHKADFMDLAEMGPESMLGQPLGPNVYVKIEVVEVIQN